MSIIDAIGDGKAKTVKITVGFEDGNSITEIIDKENLKAVSIERVLGDGAYNGIYKSYVPTNQYTLRIDYLGRCEG